MDDVSDPRVTPTTVAGLAAVLDEHTLHELLEEVLALSKETVTGALSVSVTVVEDDAHRTWNSTGPLAVTLDETQYAEDDGPCLEAIRTGRQQHVAVADMTDRWPGLAERARPTGVAGVLSTPLTRDAHGALNIYSSTSDFDEGARRAASLISEHASTVVRHARMLRDAAHLNENLSHAVASRELIGQAKGILMEREGCTRDEAFDMLRRASQRENRKLRDLAEELVARVEARAEKREQPQ